MASKIVVRFGEMEEGGIPGMKAAMKAKRPYKPGGYEKKREAIRKTMEKIGQVAADNRNQV